MHLSRLMWTKEAIVGEAPVNPASLRVIQSGGNWRSITATASIVNKRCFDSTERTLHVHNNYPSHVSGG
jgi:hypothetical protein